MHLRFSGCGERSARVLDLALAELALGVFAPFFVVVAVLIQRSACHSRRLDELYARRRSLRLDGWLIGVSFAMNLLGKPRIRAALRFVRQSNARWRRAFPANPSRP